MRRNYPLVDTKNPTIRSQDMELFRNLECLKQLLKLVKQYLDSSLELQQATTKTSKKQDSQDQQNLNLKIQQEHDSANT